jgi:hypothetical protein
MSTRIESGGEEKDVAAEKEGRLGWSSDADIDRFSAALRPPQPLKIEPPKYWTLGDEDKT